MKPYENQPSLSLSEISDIIRERASKASQYWLKHAHGVIFATVPDYITEIETMPLESLTRSQVDDRLDMWASAIGRWISEINQRRDRQRGIDWGKYE